MINYSEVKSSELVAVYNEAAKQLGRKSINKFTDKVVAIKRTQAIVEEAVKLEGFVEWLKQRGENLEASKPAKAAKETKPAKTAAKPAKAEKQTTKPKKEGKGLRMDFNFKPFAKQKAPKGENSLRAMCLAKLSGDGAKFNAIVHLVEKFDTNRGKGNGETIERRAYELVRIMHYHLGYGIRHNAETGVIQVFTKD